jgi:hypothetical protein
MARFSSWNDRIFSSHVFVGPEDASTAFWSSVPTAVFGQNLNIVQERKIPNRAATTIKSEIATGVSGKAESTASQSATLLPNSMSLVE